MSSSAVRAGGAFVELGMKGQNNIRSGLASLQSGIASWGAGLTRLFSGAKDIVQQSFDIAKASAEVGDAMGEMADRTGLSVETLSELKYAAQLSGTSLEAVERGIKAMHQAIQNGGPAAESALASIGVSANELKALSPEQQFSRIADGISKISDPGQRAALSLKLFGKAGFELAPMLSKGSAGINALREEARALGVVMTTTQADAASDFNDSMDRMNAILGSLKMKIGSALIPVFTMWMTDLAAAISVVTGAANASEDLGQATDFVGDSMTGLASPLEFFLRGWYSLAGVFRLVQSAISKVGSALAKLIQLAASSGLAKGLFGDMAANTAEIAGGIAEDLDKLAGEQFGKSLDNFDLAFTDDLSRQMEEARAKLQSIQNEVEQAQEDFEAEIPQVTEDLNSAASSISSAASDLRDTVVQITSPENLDATSTQAFTQFQQNKQDNELRELKRTLDRLNKVLLNPAIAIGVVG